MRVCLVSLNRYHHDRRARTVARTLVAAGHEVVVVASGTSPGGDVDGIPVTYVPSRRPAGWGVAGKLLRRIQPIWMRTWLHRRHLARVSRQTAADMFYPTTAACVPVAASAAGSRGLVARLPQWPTPGPRDIIRLTPHRPGLSVSPAGAGLPLSAPKTDTVPAPGRHSGLRVTLAYRKTDSNPGRYLEAAMRRAGIAVDLQTAGVDWGALPPDTDGVVFVEGPYPALRIAGRKPAIPTVMWIHHGEHHLYTNLRLVERYGVDAVLLAHSWHLTHRFGVPVHRFPFGVPTELLDGSLHLDRRHHDVAMVGGQLRRSGGTYARRQQLVQAVEHALGPERVAFVSDVDATSMASIYGDARIVLNEGGTRHYPITMRVFEAIGSGALLLTDDLPGTDVLFRRGEHYLVLEEDVAAQVERLLADPARMHHIASAGHAHAMAAHTYDHRVDRLVAVLTGSDGAAGPEPAQERVAMAAVVDDDVEVQRIARIGTPELDEHLPNREVWDVEAILDRLEPSTMEAVVVAAAGSPHLARAVRAARRYVYASADLETVRRLVTEGHPEATFEERNGVLRADLGAESYRADISDWTTTLQ